MNLRANLSLGTLLVLSVVAVACTGATGDSFSSPAVPSPTLTAAPTPAPTPAPSPAPDDPYDDGTPVPTPADSGADVTITIVGMFGTLSYSPNPATVRVGQTVAWANEDSAEHTATADGGSFDTGLLAPGEASSPIVMAVAGSFPYHCEIHGSTMVGTLNVIP